jgi:hypothetical protein
VPALKCDSVNSIEVTLFRSGKPFAQLTIYALALSQLTGIPLFDFKCAWFNEHQYCEFFPRTILARHAPNQINQRAA